jgi:hypothetical protein
MPDTDGGLRPRLVEGVGNYGQVIVRWEIGKSYAVQPGRTLKAQGYTPPLTDLRGEDVRNISQADAEAEGFNLAIDYLELWVKMHDPTRQFYWDGDFFHQWRGKSRKWEVANLQSVMDCLNDRPAEHYQAWVLDWGKRL